MKNYFLIFVLSVWTTFCFSQEVRLEQAPEFYQLFARNKKDSANVTLKGIVADKDYVGKLTLKVYKDEEIYDIQHYFIENQSFNLTSCICAGLHQFKFELYLNKDGNEKLCFSADSVVCGDAYLVTGQSNSHPSSSKATFSNPYCRSFGVKTGYVTYTDEHKTVRWGRATGNGPDLNGIGAWFKEIDYGVGAWCINLMQLIVEKYKVPVCFINGGSGSSTIEKNMLYPEKPSLETSFGRLAYRADAAGLKDHIKAIFWYQGESNANKSYRKYSGNFEILLNDWQRVYLGLEKVYLFQLHPGCGGDYQSELREIQNQIAKRNDIVEIMSTCGVPDHDGCHFSHEGYVAFSENIFPLVARDFYNGKDKDAGSPCIMKAYYSKPGREITLVFSKKVIWPSEHIVTHKMEDYFYLNGENHVIEKGIAKGNKIILSLTNNINAQTVSYLPNHFYENTNNCYQGPWILGTNGYGALSFHHFSIKK